MALERNVMDGRAAFRLSVVQRVVGCAPCKRNQKLAQALRAAKARLCINESDTSTENGDGERNGNSTDSSSKYQIVIYRPCYSKGGLRLNVSSAIQL